MKNKENTGWKKTEEDKSSAEEKLEKIISDRKTEAEAFRKIIKSLEDKMKTKKQ